MVDAGKGATFLKHIVNNFFLVVFFAGLLISSPSALASSDKPFLQYLSWLPLLSGNITKLQADKRCPQNQIHDLQVSKKDGVISAHISELNWDLQCVIDSVNEKGSANAAQSPTQNNADLLKILYQLPDFKLQLDQLKLFSATITSPFSASLVLQKKALKFNATVKSELLAATIELDLNNTHLNLEAMLDLNKLALFIPLNKSQSRYLSSDVAIHYESSIEQWFKGEFEINWEGSIADFVDAAKLSMVGEIDLLKADVVLSRFQFNAQQIVQPISEIKQWKSPYIKLSNSGPIRVNYSTEKIEALPLILRISPSNLLTSVEQGKSKRIAIVNQKLPALMVQVDAKTDNKQLAVNWIATLLKQKLNGKLSIGQNKLSLVVPENTINLRQLVTAAKSYVDALREIEIESGQMLLALSAVYNMSDATLAFESVLNSDGISGKKEDILFDGVDIQSHLKYYLDGAQKVTVIEDRQQIAIKDLFIGVPVQALVVDARFDAGQPVVQHFKARLLGGRLDLDDFKLSAPSQTIVNMSGLSLAEVIKYSAYPEIQSKAILDGMLPLKLTDDGVEITDGFIVARAPGGYIKVPENTVIKAMGRGNPAFSFTMQLLSNFQFDTLQGRIGYTDDGESDINVEINGISPMVSGTQPIKFNYSHNENILKLLQSLRFNDELERDIKERY